MTRALPLSLLLILSASAFAAGPERIAADVPAVSDGGPGAAMTPAAPGQALTSPSSLSLDAAPAAAPLAASALEAAEGAPASAAASQAAAAAPARILPVSSARAASGESAAASLSTGLQLDSAARGVEAADRIFVNDARRSALDEPAPSPLMAAEAGSEAAAATLRRAVPRSRSRLLSVAAGAALTLTPAAAGASTLSTLAHGAGAVSGLSTGVALLLLAWTLGVSSVHAWEEGKGHLWSYFGGVYKNPLLTRLNDVKGFLGVVAPALLLQGAAALLAFLGGSPVALAVLIGARIGDAIFSHMIPARLGYVPNPGLPTALVYMVDGLLLTLAFGHATFAAPHALLGLALGAGFFAVLPVVFSVSGWALRRLGAWAARPAAPQFVPAPVMHEYRLHRQTIDVSARFADMPYSGMLGKGPYIPVRGDYERIARETDRVLAAGDKLRALEARYPGIADHDALVRAYARHRALRPANVRLALKKRFGR